MVEFDELYKSNTHSDIVEQLPTLNIDKVTFTNQGTHLSFCLNYLMCPLCHPKI